MVFSSPLFLFFFLPIVLAVYVLLPRTFWNIWLLLASLVFYAWGEKLFVGVMLASISMNYVFGILVESCAGRRGGKLVLAAAVAINLALLIAFKYANFLTGSLNKILGLAHLHPIHLAPVHLPIGISFFTFHALSYVVDVYRAQARAQRDPVKLALYIALFPQLIAGPILRFHEVAAQINRRRISLPMFSDGVRRFIIGLAKKSLLANTLAAPADEIFSAAPDHLSTGAAWLGIVCYTLQIYFDFSGYSDMALGLGKMFGFRFPENFNYPYISSSIREFWRRWHISLSTWFRDYLYIPIGGNRVSGGRNYLNLLIVFFLCGLWHGASWTFIIWGLFHGTFLFLERPAASRRLGAFWRPAGHLYALLVIMTGWVFFRADSLDHALTYLGVLAGHAHHPEIFVTARQYATLDLQFALAAGVIASTPYCALLFREFHRRVSAASRAGQYALEAVHLTGLAVMFLLCAFQLAAGTYNPFIYFRF